MESAPPNIHSRLPVHWYFISFILPFCKIYGPILKHLKDPQAHDFQYIEFKFDVNCQFKLFYNLKLKFRDTI